MTLPLRARATILLFGAVASLLLLAPASHAAITRSVCSVGCGYTTISAAVAAAATGDVIEVAAGTYSENVTVNKIISIRGAQFGVDARTREVTVGLETTVVGGAAPAFTLTAPARVEGFRVAGSTDVGIELALGADGSRVSDNIVTDNKYGIEVLARGIDTMLERNRVTNNDRPGGGVGIVTESAVGVVIRHNLVEDNNQFGIALAGSAGGGYDVAVTANEVRGPATAITLSDQAYVSLVDNFVEVRPEGAIPGSGSVIALTGNVDDLLVEHNTVLRSALSSPGAGISTANGSIANGDIAILRNRITSQQRGILFATSSIFALASVEVHGNQLYLNSTAALVNQSPAFINAENNWYGCNAGPGGACNDIATSGGAVDANPWVKMSIEMTPYPPLAGQPAAVKLSAAKNSDDIVIAGGDPVPDGMPVSFTTNIGTITPATGAFVDGVATASFTAPTAGGSGTVTVQIDQQLFNANLSNLPAAAPTNSAPPTIGTQAAPGATINVVATGTPLTCNSGTWTPSPTYAYIWRRNGAQIGVDQTYTPVVADEGTDLTCRVTATAGGTASMSSAAVRVLVPPPPANTALPSITVNTTATTGGTLSCATGTWTGAGTISYTYTWLRAGVTIGSQTATSYILAAADEGKTISCRVLATAGTQSTAALSPGIYATAPAGPANTLLPATSGGTTPGTQRTCTAGAWTPSPSDFQFVWLRGTTPISGAISSAYDLVQADVGASLTCRVVAYVSGLSGPSTAATSAAFVPTAVPAPVNTAAPVLSNSPMTGTELACSTGAWTVATSYVYAWLRNGVTINGEATNAYTVAGVDEGAAIQCRVTAVANSQSAAATSNALVGYPLPAPANTSAPTISSSAPANRTGSTLTCSNGTWTPTPGSITRLWLRNGLSTGITTPTYALTTTDELTSLTCRVTATVSSGATSASTTLTTAAVVARDVEPPGSTALPTISGSAITGATLTCAPGTWTNTPDSFLFNWLHNGSAIGGQTNATYVPVVGDVAQSISCRVTAKVNTGTIFERSGTATSAGIVPSGPAGPANSALPQVATSVGPALTTGSTVACSSGTWSGSPSFTYAWLRNGTTISAATDATYVLTATDELAALACRVTATANSQSSIAISTAVVSQAPPAPSNSALPTVTGSAGGLFVLNVVLTCSTGIWSETPIFTYQWLRDGGAISGETAATHAIGAADVGASISCRVNAVANGRSSAVTSSGVVVTAVAGPSNTTPPAVTGTTTAGQTVQCDSDAWAPTPTSKTYQWLRDGGAISGATGSAYLLGSVDVNRSIACRLSAGIIVVGTAVTTTVTSAPRTVSATPTPVNSILPSITGTIAAGNQVTCNEGTWSVASSYTYQWLRAGNTLSGATNRTYDLVSSDELIAVSCRVTATATNGGLLASATSAGVVATPAGGPVNSTLPGISGTPVQGETLSCSDGAWTQSPSFTYAWLRESTVIATTTSYVLQATDVGHAVTCRVTATANSLTARAVSVGVVPTAPAQPVNSALPIITPAGSGPLIGTQATCSTGNWTPGSTFTFQWLRDSLAIGGAITNSYTLAAADALTSLSCRVTATIGATAGPQTSAALSVPVVPRYPTPPSNSVAPSITGAAMTAAQLTCAPGTWAPTSTFVYAWLRSGTTIPGAAADTYTLAAADEGASITCRVTATANAQTATAISAGIVPLAVQPPVNVSLPAITGASTVGEQLTCAPGTWDQTATYSFVWQRNGSAITGVTSDTYQLVLADSWTLITCEITATTAAAGHATATSPGVLATPLPAPTSSVQPSILGTAMTNQALVCSPGTWTRAPALSYQWLRNGAPVAGAITATYSLGVADELAAIACQVTASVGAEHTLAQSRPVVSLPVPPPVNTSLPRITGVVLIGRTLTCLPGDWTRSPAFTFQWLRNGSPISGALSQSYLIATGDTDDALSCRISASTGTSIATATSASVTPEMIVPTIDLALRTASGTARSCGASIARACSDRRTGTIRIGGDVDPVAAGTRVTVYFERLRGTSWVLSLSRTVTTDAKARYSVVVSGRLITPATWRVRSKIAASPANRAAISKHQYFRMSN